MYSLLHIPQSTVYYILTKLMRFGLKATPRKITMGSVDSEARGVQSSQLCRIKRQLVCCLRQGSKLPAACENVWLISDPSVSASFTGLLTNHAGRGGALCLWTPITRKDRLGSYHYVKQGRGRGQTFQRHQVSGTGRVHRGDEHLAAFQCDWRPQSRMQNL